MEVPIQVGGYARRGVASIQQGYWDVHRTSGCLLMKGAKGVTTLKDIYRNKSLIGIIHNLGRKPRKCRCGKGLSFKDETLCKKCVKLS
jgi:hypothetical protein